MAEIPIYFWVFIIWCLVMAIIALLFLKAMKKWDFDY